MRLPRRSRPLGRALAAATATTAALALMTRRVRGDSMEPTLRDGDLVLVWPCRSPRVGDLVVARPSWAPAATIKRVAGVAGDVVLQLDPEPVPAGHVVLLGDRADRSTDSRRHGPVPLTAVTHRVVLRYPRLSPRGPAR